MNVILSSKAFGDDIATNKLKNLINKNTKIIKNNIKVKKIINFFFLKNQKKKTKKKYIKTKK